MSQYSRLKVLTTMIETGIWKNVPYISFQCQYTGYELNIFGELGKPAAVTGDITVDITSTLQPLAAGTYFATVSALSSGGSSRSAPSANFSSASSTTATSALICQRTIGPNGMSGPTNTISSGCLPTSNTRAIANR